MTHRHNSHLRINNNNILNTLQKVGKMLVDIRMILIYRHTRIEFHQDIIPTILMRGIMIQYRMLGRNQIGSRRAKVEGEGEDQGLDSLAGRKMVVTLYSIRSRFFLVMYNMLCPLLYCPFNRHGRIIHLAHTVSERSSAQPIV